MGVAVALSVAGSDSSGGAGTQADLKTFSALGVYGASVIAALTAQNTTGVAAIHDVPAEFIAAQIDAVFSDLAVGATKIGMLGNAAAIHAVGDGLRRHRAGNIVIDPVLAATTGEALLPAGAIAALRQLIAQADLVTPNLAEAAVLLDVPIAADEGEMRIQARQLLALGAKAVLIKGGHGHGPESVDLLIEANAHTRFAAPRLTTPNTHGTGCTLAAAIAAGLAKGETLSDAMREAKAYVSGAIAAADRLGVGKGRGPVHHFFRWW